MSLSVSSGTSLITAGAVYVKATWFETINSGTAGTITGLPTGGEIVLDALGGGVDAVVSGITNGVPDYTSVQTSGGTTITTTFDENGNYVLSGTPSSYPVALIYVYRVQLAKFDYTKTISDIEFTGTIGVESINSLNGALSLVEGEGIDVSSSGTVITVSGEDATDTNKGIARFNSQNLTVSSGTVDTVQDIDTAASPTFSNIIIDNGTTLLTFNGSGQAEFANKLRCYGNVEFVTGGDILNARSIYTGNINPKSASSDDLFAYTWAQTGSTVRLCAYNTSTPGFEDLLTVTAGPSPTLSFNQLSDGVVTVTSSVVDTTSALPSSLGGTGATSYAQGNILIGNLSGGLTANPIDAGNGISVSNGDGTISLSSYINTSNLKYTDDGAGHNQINTIQNITTSSSPLFYSMTLQTSILLAGVEPDRIVATDGTGTLQTVLLGDWVVGTSNQITVVSPSDGTVILSTPQDIATTSSPTFSNLTLSSGLSLTSSTASKLLSTDASKNVVSTDLSSWVSGTTNQITVTNDLDGTITLSTPQDIGTSSSVSFSAVTSAAFTNTAATSGGIFFAGASGQIVEQASRLYYNSTTGYVGIGTSSPGYRLDIYNSGTDNYTRIQAGSSTGKYSGVLFTEELTNYGHHIRLNTTSDHLEFGCQTSTPVYTAAFYIDNTAKTFFNTQTTISDVTNLDDDVNIAGIVDINSPSGSTYNVNIKGDIHAGAAYDGGQYGTYMCTEGLVRYNNRFAYAAVAAGAEIIGFGFKDGSVTWKLGRASTADGRGIWNDVDNNFGINMEPQGGYASLFMYNGNLMSGTPVNGGNLAIESGALKYKGTSGTTTTIGPADPHCKVCGKDYMLEWANPKYEQEHFSVCVPCLIHDLGLQNKGYVTVTRKEP